MNLIKIDEKRKIELRYFFINYKEGDVKPNTKI